MTWIGIALILGGLYVVWRLLRAGFKARVNLGPSASQERVPLGRRVHLPGQQSPLQPVVLLVPEFALDEAAIRLVKSFEERGVRYETDLSLLTCACPDFVKRRGQFPGRDARRVCKHLYARFPSTLRKTLDPLLQVFLSEHHPSPHLYQAKLGQKNIVLFGITPGDEWLNVFTRRRHKGETPGSFAGEYERYGFSVERNGWAYGSKPAGAHEIRQLIAHFVSD